MARRRAASLIGLALGALLLGGCTFIRTEYGERIAPDAVQGETHRTDVHAVLAELGPPTKVSALHDGMVFLYEHHTFEEKQLGLFIPSVAVLEWFKLAIGGATADTETLLLTFDQRGLLTNRSYEQRDVDLGSGSSVQLFFGLMPTVDTSAAEADTEINEWGSRLLARPQELLNAGQSLDTMQVGLQRRGTPTRVGQHALELRERGPDR